jgi:hypothetical protein
MITDRQARLGRCGQPSSWPTLSTNQGRMRIPLTLLALPFGMLSCAPPPPPAHAAAPTSTPTEGPNLPAPRPAGPPGLESVSPPANVACVLSAAPWSTAYPELLIGLGASGAPQFAYVRTGNARLTIGTEGALLFELATPHISLRGAPATTQFIHTKRPITFGGWLVNLPGTPLTLSSEDLVVDAKLKVDGPSLPHVRALAKDGETAIVPCAELALMPQPFDPEAALPTAIVLGTRYLPEKDVPLSVTAGGAPVAILRGCPQCSPFAVLEERGPQMRIVWNNDNQALVFGWIARIALPQAAPTRPAKSPTAQPEPPPPESGAFPSDVATCTTPVRLVNGGRYGIKSFPTVLVGTVEPATPMGIVAREDTPGYVSIKLQDEPGIAFAEDALLLVPTVDLAHCRGR